MARESSASKNTKVAVYLNFLQHNIYVIFQPRVKIYKKKILLYFQLRINSQMPRIMRHSYVVFLFQYVWN
ncbi:hypothetical protein DCAR_0102370 [Daucus carota subsp. sativus]|uniref:Uncharacterized protein n=1 Tax=Daucus carota subsp. sativus TaxID=79200 RepID=A0A166H262_DAUCS|nr:hypothetical protein DCAR_0102370 [Daucus carota subsp. sativus]